MSYGFERVGALIEEGDVSIDINDAERLREIGRDIIFSNKSAKHVTDSTLSAALVVSNHLHIPSLTHDNSSSVYGFAEEETREDGWRSHVKYHWYGQREGTEIGFESDYCVDVFNDEVLFAKRSLYRLRELRDISVVGNDINIETTNRRTMADTSLEKHHIERLEKRIGNLIRRADWSAPSIY